jgi:poly-gamma-glutamate capsule biosynthesis protein CapA/YwtB (metallophosphatase superfamily)
VAAGAAAWAGEEGGDGVLTLFLCGDVMPGRGVDQILPHPGDPELRETHAKDARAYVDLAERARGPISRPVSFCWPWGDALGILHDIAPDVRVINLETSITSSRHFAPGKSVHYRMSPGNVGCVAAARPAACALANNHVLDFGRSGLADTLQALSGAGLRAVGAGPDRDAARRPACVPVGGGGRAVIVSCGTACSGIPAGWAAATGRPGVNLLPGLSSATAGDVLGQVQAAKRPGDIAVVSIHWGSNWGYGVDADQVRFTHQLIDGGVDVVHGHSSHHPRPIEVFRGKLILYGCGDCIDDYEGIPGHQAYRGDWRLAAL